MFDEFTCHQCNHTYSIRSLTLRNTMPGEYCSACGAQEKCAGCGELFEPHALTYKPDVANYICTGCEHDYQDVAKYIRPLKQQTLTVKQALGKIARMNEELRKAS